MFYQPRVMTIFFLSILLTACSNTAPAIQEPISQSPEKEYVTEDELRKGGAIVFPLFQEPEQINPFLSESGEEGLISKAIYEGLVDIDPNGSYYPRLASEIPTKENGGVSEDGLSITWKLRKDVVWSDGEPFSSEDVEFTWEAVVHPESVAFKYSQGWDSIETIETPDDYTVVVKYKEYYYNYLDQFIGSQGNAGILPKHVCGSPSDMLEWNCNRQPVGTGPFILEEWRSGESLILASNPNYYEGDKPYLDRILFPIVPDATLRKEMLLKGEADTLFWVNFEYTDELKAGGVNITPNNDMWLLRIGFNLSDGGNSDKPHPILADKQVRRAIQLALDPDIIVSGVHNGQGKIVSHELFRGLSQCPEPNLTYSKDEAKSLLEESGWSDSDGDGIRECNGCSHAEEGIPLTLDFIGFSEPPSYPIIQQIIVDELEDVGMRLVPRNPDDVWEQVTSGTYDIVLGDDGYVSDPMGLLGYYYSSQDQNIHRFRNDRFDELLAKIPTLRDASERLNSFCEIDRLLFDEIPSVWLATIPFSDAMSARLEGWRFNSNDVLTWDIANWRIRE